MLKGWRAAAVSLGVMSVLAPCSPVWAAPPSVRAADEGSVAEGQRAWGQDKRAILALREANNRAIAAHDLEGTVALDGDDFVFTGGNDGNERSAAEDRKGWAAEFARPGFDRYVRTPTEVEVGQRQGVLRAAESGTWEGLDHKAAGESRPFGLYFVHWTKASGRWREVSESYVTLGCRGPGC